MALGGGGSASPWLELGSAVGCVSEGGGGDCGGLGGVGVGVSLRFGGSVLDLGTVDLDLAGWIFLTGPVGKVPDCQGQGWGKRGRIGL